MKLPFTRLRTHSDFIWALWSQSHHRSAGFYKIVFTRFLEKKKNDEKMQQAYRLIEKS